MQSDGGSGPGEGITIRVTGTDDTIFMSRSHETFLLCGQTPK